MRIPDKPVPGMVISYSFLWKHEHDRGETSGRKDRPSVIVLIRADMGPGQLVYVVPVTHVMPRAGDLTKIALPLAIKQRLGLDDEPSWVDIAEYNVFVWPGPDLRPTRRAGSEQTCLYGFLPSRYFAKIRHALNQYRLAHKPRVTSR